MEDSHFKELFKQIKEKFEYLFKVKGFGKNSYIEPRTWFLKNDLKFQELLKNSINNCSQNQNIYIKDNKVLNILTCLNENDSIKNLYVKTENFINEISKKICEASISIEYTNENISKNNSLEKLATINEMLNILEGTTFSKTKKLKNFSTLNASIISMENFPCGLYKINLLINSNFDSENFTDLNESEQKNMDNSFIENVFNIFKEDELSINELINIENTKNTKIQKINKNFNDYKFSTIHINTNNYLVDRRYSGTTFSCFKLKIQGPKGLYESEIEYILHFLLGSIEEICDLNSYLISKTININVKGEKDNENDKRFVVLNLEFELDNFTKIGILKRIKELISIPVDNKCKNEFEIEEILNDYFPEIKEQIFFIISQSNRDDAEQKCCADCGVF